MSHLLEVEPEDSRDFGPCDCCGENSRTVWGFVHRGERTEASYFVHWSLGKVPEHGAHIDLIIGRWGEGAEPKDRCAVSLVFYPGRGVSVLDAKGRKIAQSALVGQALGRDEVIGTPLAQVVFDMIDAIWLQDRRIAEVTGINA